MDIYSLAGSDDDDSEDGGGRLAELEEQERFMRSQLQLQQGEGSESDEGEEDGGKRDLWGAKKGQYYEQGELEDEDALKEEEEEALALQREAAEGLRNEDFGAGSSSSGEEDEDAGTLGHAARQVERIDTGGAKTAQADAPELEALLESLHASLGEVRTRIGPLVTEVREGKLATAEGVSYLETKNLLLLQYCMHLLFYLMLKSEGKPAKQHPVIARLVEIRAYMEKIRPIDKKLHYQIEKLLTSKRTVKAANDEQDGEEEEMDPLQFRPNPEALVSKLDAEGRQGGAGEGGLLYKPPRLNPVAMEDDPDKDYGKRERRAAVNTARKSGRNQLVRDLAREVAEAPDELREQRAGEDHDNAAKQRARLTRRAEEEEELMMRVPLGKKELKNLKAAQRAGMAGGALLDDFADDVADLVQATSTLDSGGRLSQKFGADLSHTGSNLPSGDADLPSKMSLTDRRAKHDNAQMKQKRSRLDNDTSEQPKKKKRPDLSDSDDDVYREAEKQSKSQKAAKSAKYSAPALHMPLEEETVGGPRKVTKAVENNRGLTPHRRKDIKNPRVKGRKKFEKATVKRRGQVADVRGPSGPYGGEQTGIKARVTKSTKF